MKIYFFVAAFFLHYHEQLHSAHHATQHLRGIESNEPFDVYDAHKALTKEIATTEIVWRGEQLPEKPNKVLGQAYENVIDAALNPLLKKFGHYAWVREPNRFKNMVLTVHFTIDDRYSSYGATNHHCTVREVSPECARTLPTHEHNKNMIHIKIRPSTYRLEHTIFFPARTELMLARIMFVLGHELGHNLNEYNRNDIRRSIGRTFVKPWLWTGAFVPALAFLVFPQRLRTYPCSFLGATILSALSSSISMIRDDKRENEYDADSTSLKLVPRTMSHGFVVCFVEDLCHDYHQELLKPSSFITALLHKLKEGIKCCIFPQHNIHPPYILRIKRMVQQVVAEQNTKQRSETMQHLKAIAQETLENYAQQHDNTVIVQQVIARVQQEVHSCLQAFTERPGAIYKPYTKDSN